MFNDYIWKTYLGGTGKEVVEFFEENLVNDFTEDYAEKVCGFHRDYCPSRLTNESLRSELLDVKKAVDEDLWILEDGEYSIDSAIECFFDGFLGEVKTPKNVFNYFSGSVAYFTTLLAIELSELFIPYYFTRNFNILEKIAQEFEIDLPELPLKRDYKGRFFYYGELCKAFYEFRTKHGMSPFEFCAFLYDFAPKYVGGIDSYIVKELPPARSAYFIGATKDDAFLSDDEDSITPWQCNPDTMAGDAIVMYIKSPVSAVDSVWRSVSVGFNDPFFYYYRCTYIAKPQKINRVSQKQLEKDAIFKELPIVRKNMQGINGVELYPSVYNHLLDFAKSDLPRFDFAIDSDETELKREKDVENKLIKKLLAELGYAETDYAQQLQIRVGNHNFKLIPDFVIKPVVSNGHYSASYLIEAKYSIPSSKILDDVKIQARSYAKQLGAAYSVIAAKEGIWITSSVDDYTKNILSFSWAELKNEDDFHQVFALLGNGKKTDSGKKDMHRRLSRRAAEFSMLRDDEKL